MPFSRQDESSRRSLKTANRINHKIQRKVMKILVCVSEYFPEGSGIAIVAHNLVQELKSMHGDYTICTPNGPDIQLGNSQLIKKTGIVGLLYYWLCVSIYIRKKNIEYDVIWLHNPLFLLNVPHHHKYLITIHSTYYRKLLDGVYPLCYYRIASWIEKYSINKISRQKPLFLGVSTTVIDSLKKIGVPANSLYRISNGVKTDLFKPVDNKKRIRAKFGIPEDNVVLLSLGRLSESKQPLKLIEVFEILQSKCKRFSLVVAGTGELMQKTKDLVQEKKIENVIFLGHINHELDAPDLYAASDYFIMTSKSEGNPLTLIEAISSGLPCIVSNIPPLSIVEELNCGIVVDFSDTQVAAQKILEYLKKPDRNHSCNGRTYILENLSWSKIGKQYQNLFENLLRCD